MSEQKKGILDAVLAYFLWGLFPLYWKLLSHVNSLEILLGRVIWSFIFTAVFILLLKQGALLKRDLAYLWQHKKQFWSLATASVVIGINWFVYIWAVNHDQVLQSSLGYYINPLISVVFAMVFFKERLTKWSIIAVLIAALGVVTLTISYGQVPYIALSLALSFGFYGVLKKKIVLDATRGLAIETLFLVPVAMVVYIAYFIKEKAAFLHVDASTDMLLVLSGVVTAIPLVLFAKGAQRIPMVVLGFIQYLSPTIVFFLGIFLYKEPFSHIEMIAFACIWIAIIIFSIGGIIETKKRMNSI